AIAAAVEVVHGNHVVAAVQQFQDGGGGGHAGGEGEAAAAALQRSHAPLPREAGRVVGAGVFEALVLARRRLGVGRGRVDRRHDRAGGRIGGLAAMDRQGGERTVARAQAITGGFFGHGGSL